MKYKSKTGSKAGQNSKKGKMKQGGKAIQGSKTVQSGKTVQSSKPVPSVPSEWLYMTDREIGVREIAASFESEEMTEIWEAAGVAEVLLGEKDSMDMELTENDLGDEESNRFLEENQVKTLFLVTVPPLEFEKAKACMEKIIAANGGFFCGDTEDFTPTVR
ncbi:MAG: hypothetical protein SO101_14850 [Lachnospiraceae bacterium]|nr:hypothetical protein [Lachnospiraceae bacterium]